jgi:hypothetical protein
MPNLKPWIEAQLKRGNSREAIMRQLLKRGYSRKAVAEVDRIAKLNNNKTSLPHILVLIMVIVMLLGISYLVAISSDQQEAKKGLDEIGESDAIDGGEKGVLKINNVLFPIPEELKGYKNLCSSFNKFNDTISCFNAIQKSLGAYNGTVISVDRTFIIFPADNTLPGENAWLIKIKLDNPKYISPNESRYDLELAVNRFSGKLKAYRLT